jgi:hypothetical protein
MFAMLTSEIPDMLLCHIGTDQPVPNRQTAEYTYVFG